MTYNFDEIIDRNNTACYKYDLRSDFFQHPGVLPLWVADMDFRTPDFIMKAIHSRLRHEILGYSFHPESQYQSIIDWNYRQHGWSIEKEWIDFAPGVVPALNFAVLAFTRPGDKIIIQTPVYFPFFSSVRDHNRKLVMNPLELKNGRYYMNFQKLKAQIDKDTKMLILCSPHNPTGNVWTREELMELAGICLDNNLLVVSDEIHADIVYEENKHIPFAMLGKEISDSTITLMSASKTFNMAGMATSYFIASNRKLFIDLKKSVDKLHLGMGNIIGNIAQEAAYNEGSAWLSELIAYLRQNIVFAKDFINRKIPVLEPVEPEATFLLWIDFRKTGFNDKEVRKKLIETAQVGLSNGILFGKDGTGFQRINVGCPRKILEKGLEQIANAFGKLQ